MWLNLSLFAAPAVDDIDIDRKNNWIELANETGAWFIWNYFKNLNSTVKNEDEQIIIITKEAWESFIKILKQNYKLILDYIIFKTIKRAGFTPSTKEDIIRDQIEDITRGQIKEAQFKKWYKNNFNTALIFGGEFEAHTMIRWMNMDTEVRKYLDDPTYILFLKAKY